MQRDKGWACRLRGAIAGGALAVGLSVPATAGLQPLDYQKVTVQVEGRARTARIPVGFELEVLVADLDAPRLLTFAPNGDLFAGSKDDRVYRFPPPYRSAQTLLELSGYPHSVAFRSGEILIARTDGLFQAPYTPGQTAVAEDSVSRLARLPGGGGHTSRTVAVGPDGRIYLGLGITGNCSDQYVGESYPFDDRRGGVLVLEEATGSGAPATWKAFASGLRNPVGFDWHPTTGVLYASNNGPDHWGYELPPETFSKLPPDSYHGMPWFQWDGKSVRRDSCIERDPPRPQSEVPVPAATFPARSAPMGVAFVPAGALVPALEGDAVVAVHGSWGTRPTGGFFGDPATRRPPAVVVVRFENGEARRVDDLITGFQLESGDRWARPIGVAVGPDGALYISSDAEAEALFRLRNKAP